MKEQLSAGRGAWQVAVDATAKANRGGRDVLPLLAEVRSGRPPIADVRVTSISGASIALDTNLNDVHSF